MWYLSRRFPDMWTSAPNTRLSEAESRILEVVDQRVNDTVDQLVGIQGRMEDQFAGMMKSIELIKSQLQQPPPVKGEAIPLPEAAVVQRPEPQEEWGRPTHYVFPKFDGDGFEGWKMHAKFFFDIAKVPMRDRVRVAAIHVEGKALQWHRGFTNLQGEAAMTDWEGYVRAMGARFGTQAHADPLADLRNLKQRGSLQDYMDAFDELYPRTGIREEQAMIMFLSRLIDELQMPVRMFKPKSLAEVFSLAKLQEITVCALGGKGKGGSGGGQSSNTGYSYVKSLAVTTTPSKSSGSSGTTAAKDNRQSGSRPYLTLMEMDERRKKGLCYWCPEKFTLGHACSRHRAFVMLVVEELEQLEEEGDPCPEIEEEAREDDELQLSSHAMWGIKSPQIMRIRGKSQGKSLRVLIDTGSKHNFLSTRMLERLRCETVEVPPKAVEVANRKMLHCDRKCANFGWEM